MLYHAWFDMVLDLRAGMKPAPDRNWIAILLMPFDTRAGFKLSLAIAAALGTQALHAQSPDERLWSCNLTPAGEWECDVNEQAVQKSTEPQDAPAAKVTKAAAGAPAQPEKTTAQMTAQKAAPARTSQLPTTRPATRPAASQAPGADEWSCSANGENWDCTHTPSPQLAATPDSQEAIAAIPLDQAAPLDWYPYAPGDAPGACSGRYLEPELALLQDTHPLDAQPILIDALNSTTELDGLTTLEGGIQIQRGGRLLSSTRGEYNRDSNQARLFGAVQYRESGFLLQGDQADADMLSGDTRFHNAQYVMHQEHMRGSASRITRFGDNRVRLDDGAVTYCEPGSNAWQLAADSIELDPESGRGVARHATLDVAGVPIIYTPYMSFPIDDRRQSGFLYPSVRYSAGDGIELATPYYFNIAPNLDDTLTPRYIGERGLLLENELRYLNSWSHNQLSTAWLASDDKYEDDRWLLGLRHRGQPLDNLYSRVDYTRVSDDDYFEDLSTSLEVQRDDHLDQQLELLYQQPNWNLSFSTLSYQTIDGTTPYEHLPQLRLNGYESRIGGVLDLEYEAEYVRFDRDLDSRYAPAVNAAHLHDRTTGDRLHLEPRLSLAFERPWGYLRPGASFWYSQYNLDNDRFDIATTPSTSATLLSLDSGLVVERDYRTDKGIYTQTLEPRLYLLHASADDQSDVPLFDSTELDFSYYSLFHDTGWSGNDRVADTSQATVGLSSALFSDRGLEIVRLAAAQAYYFSDRDPGALRPGDRTGQESSSNLATLANWTIAPGLRLTHNGEIDRDSYEFLEHNYKLSYLPGDRRLLYLNYRNNIEKTPAGGHQQVDLAFRWPLSRQWTGYGRWQHDIEASENLETLLGIEYSSCCWKVRLTGRNWVVDPDTASDGGAFETDKGVFLQFVLRGLGSFGQGEGSEYLKEITGYDEDDDGTF